MRKELPVGGFPTATKFDPHAVYPLHMYHETLPPRIAHTATEEEENRADGYGTEYVHQEYPKHVNVTVENLDEQKEAVAEGFSGDVLSKHFPKTLTKVFNSAAEEVGLTPEKKADPFGIEHPPVPTSNVDDLEGKAE